VLRRRDNVGSIDLGLGLVDALQLTVTRRRRSAGSTHCRGQRTSRPCRLILHAQLRRVWQRALLLRRDGVRQLPPAGNQLDSFSRFDAMPACDRQTDIHGAETTFVRSIMLQLGEPVHCCCPLGVGPAKWSCIYAGTHEVTQAPGERRVRGRHAEPQDDRAHERRLGPVYVAPSVASRHCVETAERTELVSARR